MARRNPMNERYGKHTAPSGKTRRSAASAKPKRAAASGASASGGSAKKPPSAASRRSAASIHPPTPEYKRWRTIWWVFLGGAIVLSTLAWWLWQDDARRDIGNWVLGGGYLMIFAAIFIDWTKMRPLRRAWMEAGGKLPKAEGGEEKAAKADASEGKAGTADTNSDES